MIKFHPLWELFYESLMYLSIIFSCNTLLLLLCKNLEFDFILLCIKSLSVPSQRKCDLKFLFSKSGREDRQTLEVLGPKKTLVQLNTMLFAP